MIYIYIYIHIYICLFKYLFTNTSATTSPNTSPYLFYGHLPEYLSSPEHSVPRGGEPKILRTLCAGSSQFGKGIWEECSSKCSKHIGIYIYIYDTYIAKLLETYIYTYIYIYMTYIYIRDTSLYIDIYI